MEVTSVRLTATNTTTHAPLALRLKIEVIAGSDGTPAGVILDAAGPSFKDFAPLAPVRAVVWALTD